MNSGGDFPARFSCVEPGSMTRHQLTRLPSIWVAVLDHTDVWSSPFPRLCRLSPNHWETLREMVTRARDIRVVRWSLLSCGPKSTSDYLRCAQITSVTPWVLTFWGTPTIQDRGPLGNLLVPGGPDEHSWLLYLSSLVSWLGRVDPCLVEGSDASLIEVRGRWVGSIFSLVW